MPYRPRLPQRHDAHLLRLDAGEHRGVERSPRAAAVARARERGDEGRRRRLALHRRGAEVVDKDLEAAEPHASGARRARGRGLRCCPRTAGLPSGIPCSRTRPRSTGPPGCEGRRRCRRGSRTGPAAPPAAVARRRLGLEQRVEAPLPGGAQRDGPGAPPAPRRSRSAYSRSETACRLGVEARELPREHHLVTQGGGGELALRRLGDGLEQQVLRLEGTPRPHPAEEALGLVVEAPVEQGNPDQAQGAVVPRGELGDGRQHPQGLRGFQRPVRLALPAPGAQRGGRLVDRRRRVGRPRDPTAAAAAPSRPKRSRAPARLPHRGRRQRGEAAQQLLGLLADLFGHREPGEHQPPLPRRRAPARQRLPDLAEIQRPLRHAVLLVLLVGLEDQERSALVRQGRSGATAQRPPARTPRRLRRAGRWRRSRPRPARPAGR